jgi:hypothetical protein
MSLMDIITIIGSVVSIIGAIVSYMQYKKAEKASRSAIVAKDFIISRKNSIELSQILNDAKIIENILINHTINIEQNQRGRNEKKEMTTIQKFISKLNEIKSHIDINIKIKLDNNYDKILNCIDKDNFYKYDELLNEIRELISVLSNEINNNFYNKELVK